MIDSFSGKYRFLSNFFIEPDGTFVEREFQAAKAANLEEHDWVMSSPNPSVSKKRGRSVKLIPNWENFKIEVMRLFVTRKFNDHPELAQALRETGDQELIEGNDWGDTFWGVCNGVGENHLGKILMEIRAGLLGE